MVNRMSIAVGTQVNLRVRVAEVSRTVTKELGFNWESLFNIGAFTLGIATGRDAITAAGTILRGDPMARRPCRSDTVPTTPTSTW